LFGIRRWLAERSRDLIAARHVLAAPPEVVIVRDDFWSLLLVGAAAHLKRVRCCYWMSFLIADSYVEAGLVKRGLGDVARIVYGKAYGLIGRWALHCFASDVFAQSEVMAGVVESRMGYKRRITPVHMGVDFELLPVVARSIQTDDDLVLGYSGAITILRGFERLFRGMAIAREVGIPVRLVLVGWYETQQDETHLSSLINDLGLADAIDFVGRMELIDACRVIADCDGAISPYPSTPLYVVGSPTKLFEYLALGKPVIATDHPVQRAVVEEAGAGWVVEDRPEAYATAIAEIYNKKICFGLDSYSSRLKVYCEAKHSYLVRSSCVNAVLQNSSGLDE